MVNRDITMDLGLTEGGLKFLSLLNTQSTFYENWITTEQLSQGPQLRDAEQAQLMDSDAYHNSPLTNWTPGTEDNAYMDQEYLSVPKHLDHPNPLELLSQGHTLDASPRKAGIPRLQLL